eukprot:7155777-Lingulodinium_polyedra.AAC.1
MWACATPDTVGAARANLAYFKVLRHAQALGFRRFAPQSSLRRWAIPTPSTHARSARPSRPT